MIRSVGYDCATQVLEIEFHHGRIYRYSGVPDFIYQGLMVSKSKGSFFNSRIVERYPSSEVSTPLDKPGDSSNPR
jgi:hypothetical protein